MPARNSANRAATAASASPTVAACTSTRSSPFTSGNTGPGTRTVTLVSAAAWAASAPLAIAISSSSPCALQKSPSVYAEPPLASRSSSQAPTSRGDALQYYEVELHGLTELQLRRYQGFAQAGKKREQIAFTLTYEGLAKLLRDLGVE